MKFLTRALFTFFSFVWTGLPLVVHVILQSPSGTAGQSHAIPSWVFFDCSVHKLPGLYADRVRGCHVFNFCSRSGIAFQMVCPNNTLFDQRKQDCVDPNDTPVYCPTIWEVPEPTRRPIRTRSRSPAAQLEESRNNPENQNLAPFRGSPAIVMKDFKVEDKNVPLNPLPPISDNITGSFVVITGAAMEKGKSIPVNKHNLQPVTNEVAA